MTTPPLQLLAQLPPGLEPILVVELEALGIEGRALHGGVEWEGTPPSVVEANVHLRTASRVLVRVADFGARALGELERKAGGVDWGRWLPPGPLALRVSSSRSRLYHEGAIEERIRRAIGEAAATDPAETPDPSTLLVVRVHRDRVTISLDSSGEHLHRRGYRTHVGEAPIRETLAAAALLAVGWDGTVPLADPFCGSGAIAIEGALLARRIPPGMASAGLEPRGWAFEGWGWMQGEEPAGEGEGAPEPGRTAPARASLDRVIARAREHILPNPVAPILASDRDAGMASASAANAERAGVAPDLHIEQTPFTSAPLPPEPGWIVTNPPYGGRLGNRNELRGLYAALGRAVRGPWAGWKLAFFCGDPILARSTGLPVEEVLRTRSGGSELKLYRFEP